MCVWRGGGGGGGENMINECIRQVGEEQASLLRYYHGNFFIDWISHVTAFLKEGILQLLIGWVGYSILGMSWQLSICWVVKCDYKQEENDIVFHALRLTI